MSTFLLKRGLQAILVLIVASFAVFLLGRLSGSPAALMLPVDATEEQMRAFEIEIGLDKPLYVQYWRFASAAATGDFGHSLQWGSNPVSELFIERLPATLQLAGAAMLITFGLGIPLGIGAALTRGRWLDTVFRWFAAIAQATPSFWLAFLLIAVVGVWLGWLPFAGREGIQSVVLPAIAIAMYPFAGVMRLTRSGMLEVLGEEYVFFARAKGLSERLVILRHALRNALIPVVTFSGIIVVSNFLVGSLAVEVVFAWPGVGRLAYESVVLRDFPTLQGLTLIFATMFIVANLIVDISYALLDPRIRRLDDQV